MLKTFPPKGEGLYPAPWKLKQLASVVKARFDELESTKKDARWSLIFGIAGVVGAVISIMMSMFQAIKMANKANTADA